MTINGTTDATWTTQNEFHDNLNNGFDLWVNGGAYLRAPFMLDGNSSYGEGDSAPVVGFVWVSKHESITDGHNFAESIFDYTDNGNNTNIPAGMNNHNPLTSPIIDSKYFSLVDAEKETKILIYSVAPEGECLEDTLKWLDANYIVDKNGAYVLDKDGNYLVDKI